MCSPIRWDGGQGTTPGRNAPTARAYMRANPNTVHFRWDRRSRLLPLQVQDDLARSEEERVAGTAREKLDRGGACPWLGSKLNGTAMSFALGEAAGAACRLLSREAADARAITYLPNRAVPGRLKTA